MTREIEILTKDICFKHEPAPQGSHHPENSSRLEKIIDYLKKEDFKINHDFNIATQEQIQSVHSKILFDRLKKTQQWPTYFTADTYANQFTFDAAMAAAGAAIYAMKESSVDKTILAAVRPPGHHASESRAMGFCYFNNIAIAAKIALQESQYQRIAILDFDNHYGNGTAAIFKTTSQVLYISSHADPRMNFPGSGFIEEKGTEDGEGFTVNIPLSSRTDDTDIIYLYENITRPILLEYQPEIIMISAGFDGYVKDPLGMLGFTQTAYEYFGTLVGEIGSELQIPYFSMLEGGYDIEKQPQLLASYLRSFNSQPINSQDYSEPSQSAKDLLNRVKKVHQEYWSF